MKLYAWVLTLLCCLPVTARAHLLDDGAGFSPWSVDPLAVLLLLLSGWLYWRGNRQQRQKSAHSQAAHVRRWRHFWLGWSTLAVALASPLDPMGEVLFWVHMVQHELLMLVAAPLLVASRPSSALLRGLSMPVARGIGRITRARFWGVLLSPPIAWTIHTIGLWSWHLPWLFDAGLTNTWVHALQHASFLWIALVFWFALMRGPRSQSAAAVLYFFTTAIHVSLLGALLTFAPEPWYTPYLSSAPEWGLSALEDQQLGGLIMWMPAGIVFVAAGLVSLARTMRDSDTNAPYGKFANASKSNPRGISVEDSHGR